MLFRAKQFFEIFFSNYERNWMGFDSFWWVNLPTVLFIAQMFRYFIEHVCVILKKKIWKKKKKKKKKF